MSNHNTPTEPGLYFASDLPMSEEWNLIVKIYGEKPFLKALIWYYTLPGMVYSMRSQEKLYFGSKIQVPKRDPRARPKDKQDEVH